MPFCVQCGAKLEDGAKFCTVCGAKQPEAAAPVYVPPTEEKPVEPQGYSYTPPASSGAGSQTSYNYDPTIYGGKNGGSSKPPKKKGGAILFIALAAIAVIAAIIYIVAGKGGGKTVSSDDPVLGLYTAQKAETAGISIGIETMWKNGFTIELKDKGKATINVDGETGSAKWTLDGKDFTIKGSGVDCSGTLDDGMLTLKDVMGTGVTLFFTKDGAALPAEVTPTPKPVSEPAASTEPAPATGNLSDAAGFYNADKAVAYGMDIEIPTMWAKGFSIDLKDDGKCSISVDGTPASGTWSLNGETVTLDVPGFNMDGTLTDGVLVFEDIYGMGIDLYFTQDGSMKPAEETASSSQTASKNWWDGDWYGWWSVVDGGGTFADEDIYIYHAWDVCAEIIDNGDGTGLVFLWDEDVDDGQLNASAEVIFSSGTTDKGRMVSKTGTFVNEEIGYAEWDADPGDGETSIFGDMIVLHGYYTSPNNSDNWFEYYIFLRPWGVRWEDVATADTTYMLYTDMMPVRYSDWYLPLIEANAPMPDDFDGLH